MQHLNEDRGRHGMEDRGADEATVGLASKLVSQRKMGCPLHTDRGKGR